VCEGPAGAILRRMLRLSGRARLVAACTVAAALLAPTTASAGIVDSLRGWWPMWEGRGQLVYDWSGRGNTGTLGSTAGPDANDPTWIRGFLGSALSFGGDDFVRIKDTPDLEPSAITVSAWVRASQSPGTFRYIVSKGGDNCVSSSWALGTFNNGGIGFFARYRGNWVRSLVVEPSRIWDGKWHHVAGTYDGSAANLYIDGKSTGASLPEGDGIEYGLPTSGDASFGSYLGTCDLFYTGDIAQVAVFGEALPVDAIWSRVASYFPRPAR
jgi:hypothetical protein